MGDSGLFYCVFEGLDCLEMTRIRSIEPVVSDMERLKADRSQCSLT